MSDAARRDPQTLTGDGKDAGAVRIDGVQLREARNVLTRSGTLLEVFRAD